MSDQLEVVAKVVDVIYDELGIHAQIQWVSEEKRKQTEEYIAAIMDAEL